MSDELNRAAPIAAQLDQQEQPKSDFLNHLAEAGKAVEGWPAWKTGMWKSEQAAQLDQSTERAAFEAWSIAERERQSGHTLDAAEKEYLLRRLPGERENYNYAPSEWPAFQGGYQAANLAARRTEPVAAQLDADNLPPLDKFPPFPEKVAGYLEQGANGVFLAYSWNPAAETRALFTEDQYRQGQRDAIAPYAERIRLLERELEHMVPLTADGRSVWIDGVGDVALDLRRSQQPAHSLDTPKTGDKHAKLPWRITDAPRKIVGADGATVANLTALDLPNAELIVSLVNQRTYIDGRTAAPVSSDETPDWRVGEFWSSARLGEKVLMLARGIDIENFGRHKDFIRWVDGRTAGTAPEAAPETKPPMPILYRFDRYRGACKMAEGIGVHATSMAEAIEMARELARNEKMPTEGVELRFVNNNPCAPACHCAICKRAATPSLSGTEEAK